MDTENQEEHHNRTVVVSGVPLHVLPVSRTIDKLIIHFQSRRKSHGGDVEGVKYPTNMEGVAFVTFDNVEDAEKVVRKDRQVMTDGEFTDDYILTVFPFSQDVFLYVSSAMVDLSVFGGDQTSLMDSLRSAHRSLRFTPLPHKSKASIEGPFAAIRALREDLIHRAGQLKSSTRIPMCKSKQTPHHKVILHHEAVDAEQEPTASSGFSVSPESRSEVSEVQSLSLHRKCGSKLCREKVCGGESLTGEIFSDVVEHDDKRRDQNFLKISSCSSDFTRRQVDGEESIAAITSSLSSLKLAEDTKQQREENSSQKHSGSDKIPAAKTRSRNTSESSKDPKSGPSKSSEVKATKRLCVTLVEEIWVDLYTFRYVEKFQKKDLDRCWRNVEKCVENFEGNDLVRISLTERQTSAGASKIQKASKELEMLMEIWQSLLRVHQFIYNMTELSIKQREKLTKICEDVNVVFDDVLYVFEDTCIKIIGPSTSSHLFYRRVEDRVAKLKNSPINSLKI